MAYLAGKMVLAVEAGAPNNAGAAPDKPNRVLVKTAKIRGKTYPYVSAQAAKRWLRDGLAVSGWDTSPVEIEGNSAKNQKVVTAGDPIAYPDDDIFGYMHTQKASKGKGGDGESGTTVRDAVFMLGTFMSVEPHQPTLDFVSMTRGHSGDPIISDHEFFTADLAAPFLLDVAHVGVFTFGGPAGRTNFLSGSETAHVASKKVKVTEFRGRKALVLADMSERRSRVADLLDGIAMLAGGAKRALHYGDRTPALIVAAPMKGGINPFDQVVFGSEDGSGLRVDGDALRGLLDVYADEITGPVLVGWRPNFRQAQRDEFTTAVADLIADGRVVVDHPHTLLRTVARDVRDGKYDGWFSDS
jgi:CRISPR-associated protein Cst2